ncbi:MAG: ROK family protein [Lawsonibacter sp.]|nr:ROK family protein [Lawsonibacter sp.]
MYIGIDIGGTNLVAGLTNGKGQIVDKVSRPVDKSWDPGAVCRQTAQLALQAAQVGGFRPEQIQAVGVGLPGLVDNKTGVAVQTPNMPFSNTPFRALFQEEWDIPVFLGNDANCAAIGEYWAGAAKGRDPAVVITLGTGIGGGLVAGGKLYTGAANSGMEVGHMCIHPNGALCNCGRRGCWEQYGSASALIRITREEMERSPKSALWECAEGDLFKVTGRTAFQAARGGDETARKVLSRYLQGLSLGLINIVNILQPEIICLGGGVSNAEDDLLLDPLRELVRSGCFDPSNPPRLERASLGNDAGVVGAAMLCHMF